LRADSEYTLGPALQHGVRSELGVPLVRDGEVIGVIIVGRTEVRPFTKRQIALVETFADQAVIAIENTRLFEEVQQKNAALNAANSQLTETLEQQTATGEILKVIASSPSDAQPVFDAIVAAAPPLVVGGISCAVRLLKGDTLHVVAWTGLSKTEVAGLSVHIGSDPQWARLVHDRQAITIADLETDISLNAEHRDEMRKFGVRSALVVPLLQDGLVIGTIGVGRAMIGPFAEHETRILQTFADQAVIAIENTRLFEAEQASKRELQESLEYQTAAAEVLDVISRSPTNSQPVLNTIAASVRRLTGCKQGTVFFFDGQQIHLAAQSGLDDAAVQAIAQSFPKMPHRGSAVARAILTRQVAYVPDVLADSEYSRLDVAEAAGYRCIVSVPMVREDHLVGAIVGAAANPAAFSQRQIGLLQTFANQAVIAINNAGLFEEVQARNRDLTALGEVARAVSSTLDLKVVLKTIVDRAVELSNTDGGSIFYYRDDVGRFELGETAGLNPDLVERTRKLDIAVRDSGLGEAIANRQPLQIADLTKRPTNPLRAVAIEAGFRAALIVPLLSSESALGTLVLQRRTPGEFPEAVINLMQSFADQSAIALENARLFDEIAQKKSRA
jgi:GAF domain-containing protein